jgi:hypothetical protein
VAEPLMMATAIRFWDHVRMLASIATTALFIGAMAAR